MRETIVWSTTSENFDQRKLASETLGQIFRIEWQLLRQTEPPEMCVKTKHDLTSPAIYIFEIDSKFALEQCRIVKRTFTNREKSTSSVLLLGVLAENDLPNGSTFQEWLPILDGVITQSAVLADEIALVTLTPVKHLPLPATRSKPQRQFFVENFSAFIKTARLAKIALTAMEKVSNDIQFLGVDSDVILIDSVAEVLSQFWS
jgi:hypothetical protein